MLSFFPKQISNKAIVTYLVSLAIVSIVFMDHAMPFKFILIGLMFVLVFFLFSNSLSVSWKSISPKPFVKKLFWTALALRVAWVLFSYYFFTANTGKPFEWGAADSVGYHDTATWLSEIGWNGMWNYEFHRKEGVSDVGYEIYLFLVYSIFGPNIFITRLLKSVWSALTCVLVYRLASRNFGESTGRMAGIFCMLMPNLIYYCGMHVKETEMVTLVVAYLERADRLIRGKKFGAFDIGVVAVLALSLFFFRTVLGAVAVISLFVGLFFIPGRVVKKGNRVILIVLGILFVAVVAGGTISTEIEGVWNDRNSNQELQRYQQEINGNLWAKYATGAVMAPIIFLVPFATMVDLGQYEQLVLSGGNYVKNVLGVFLLIALFSCFFSKRNWRNFSFIGSFMIGYLLVIALSAFANAERFHLPALPCILMLAAYGVSMINEKNYKFVKFWFLIVFVLEFAWAYFKIGSRGLL